MFLEFPYFGEGFGVHDVGDRTARTLVAVGTRRFSPALRLHTALFAEQGEEDFRLLRAEARQVLQPAQHFLAVGVALGPDLRWYAVVVLDDVVGERLRAPGHRAAVPVDGGWGGGEFLEFGRVGLGDTAQIESAHSPGQFLRPPKGVFHRVLLIQEHAEQQGEIVGAE